MSTPDQRQTIVTSYEQLPPHYKELLHRHGPQLRVPKAVEIAQRSRAGVYEDLAKGLYFAVKDGTTTKIDTLSLLIHLANLPPADFAPVSPGRRRKAAGDTESPRRGRKPIAAPPTEQHEPAIT